MYNYIKDHIKNTSLKKLEERLEQKISLVFDRINSKLLEVYPESIPVDRDVHFCLMLFKSPEFGGLNHRRLRISFVGQFYNKGDIKNNDYKKLHKKVHKNKDRFLEG